MEEYLAILKSDLEQILEKPMKNIEETGKYIKNNNSLPLGFKEWFYKYGENMLLKLTHMDFKKCASDEFLDELDYYQMILKDDIEEANKEIICSDLVSSLTRLNKMIATEN